MAKDKHRLLLINNNITFMHYLKKKLAAKLNLAIPARKEMKAKNRNKSLGRLQANKHCGVG